MLRWRIVRKEGNVIVRFGSHELELEGVQLRVKAGDLQRDGVLKKETSDQVGTKITITQEEWKKLPKNVVLRPEIVGEDSDSDETR